MKKSAPTMQDIASRANVSKMTVSRVLRSYPHISPVIQKRVLKIARDLGYHLNPLLSHFSTHTKKELYHGTFAWIDNHFKKNGSLTSLTFKRYFSGAAERAKELGYNLEIFWLRQSGMTGRRLSKILLARNIRGLLLAPQPNIGEQPLADSKPELEWDHFSIVNFGYSLPSPEFHMVTHNQFQTMITAIRKLRSLGYRRIGYAVRSELNQRIEKQFLAAFLLEQQRLPSKHRIPPLMPENIHRESFNPWFLQYKPEVVLTSSIKKIHKHLLEMNMRIPKDVGLVEIAGAHRYDEHSYTRMDQSSDEVGRQSVDLLLNLISRNSMGIPKVRTITLIEGEWIPGQTTHSLVKA
jgi:LacI family transcriptional regulator